LHPVCAPVESEREFVNVTLHVLPAHVMINTMIAALEQRPKTFNRVCGVQIRASLSPFQQSNVSLMQPGFFSQF
jgi:hypothetical protein